MTVSGPPGPPGPPDPAGPDDPARPAEKVTFLIIGTGFSGLGAAIRLRQAGYTDLVVLERAGDVGGTWRDNTYPGCRCDVQSNLYSYSFEPKPDWSESFPSQPELWAYLRAVTSKHGLRRYLRFGHEVTSACWDADSGRWLVSTTAGNFAARYLIAGVGALVEPSLPDIPGIESFRGVIMHSARWDDSWQAAGRRVAVVGTGASAIQIVPSIQPEVEHLTVFQRTAPYVVPHTNHPVKPVIKVMYRLAPWTQRASRALVYLMREFLVLGFVKNPRILKRAEVAWRKHMENAISDPPTRGQLTPTYRLGCKRVLPSNDYYPAIAKDNVSLVTEKIIEFRPDALVTADGAEHPVDTVILATGFHVTDNPTLGKITGTDGQTLADAFGSTYLGTVVPGFPNYFQLTGANTGLGHSSMLLMIESQLAYIADGIAKAEAGGRRFEVRPEVAAAYNAELQRKLPKTVWGSGCSSWYLDGQGRNLTLWPGFTFDFRRRTREFRRSDFRIG
ncbi:MAG TPA: NAD(P)/FAD-dependent oxidoreductase [Streptosporangiaceae bacterium]|nr:NAD(P)/FAD-dependent oxidoreductase [Streptosporangiaceae bacterium]